MRSVQRPFRRLLWIVVLSVLGTVGLPASAGAATPALTITGTVSCDAPASRWVITWQVQSTMDTAGTVLSIVHSGSGTLTGLATGDTIPPSQSGPVTLTEVVPSIVSWVSLPLKIKGQWGTTTNFSVGSVALPPKCGQFIFPTITYVSSCDGTLHTTVTLDASDPAGEVAFDTIDPSGTEVILQTVTVGPGGTTSFDSPPGYQALFMRVYYLHVALSNGRWIRPDNCGGLAGEVPLSSFLARANGRYVTAESAGAKPLIANRPGANRWEGFQVVTNPDGTVSFWALANGKYVTAESAGAKPLIANRSAIGKWEKFKLVTNSDGTVSFWALANGKYVTAESAGAKPLIANRSAIGKWEKFDRLAMLPYLTLRADNGKYVTAESAGAKPLIANRTAVGVWEQFRYTQGDSLVAYANNRIVSTDSNGAPLIANGTSETQAEYFYVVNNADGSFSLLSVASRRFVSARNGDAGPLVADSVTIGPAEEFNRPTS